MFSYDFPAIKGIQSGCEYYICMVPLGYLEKIFVASDEYVTAEYRAQRTLNEKRIPIMSEYIVQNRDSYVFSALAASISGNAEFTVIQGDLGHLKIDFNAKFLINDGQHRKAAIIEALRKDETLANETISVVFYKDKGLTRSQQMFTDLNKHAVVTSKSINTKYESRQFSAVLTKKLVSSIPFFDSYTDCEKDNLGDNSPMLFTLNNFHNAVISMMHDVNAPESDEFQEFVREFWGTVVSNMIPWQDFIKKEITKIHLRKHYIAIYGITILALGKVGNWIYINEIDDWKNILGKLSEVDWRRDNKTDWLLRAIDPTGKISKSNATIALTYIRIKKLLGIKLTKEESIKDKSVRR